MIMLGSNNLIGEIKKAWNTSGNLLTRLILVNLFVFVAVNVLKVFLVLSGGSVLYQSLLRFFMVSSLWHEVFTRPWTLFSYAFLHEGFFHFLFNMLFLYWFGRLLSDFLPSKNLLSLYLTGAVLSAFFFVFMYNLVPYYQARVGSYMLGASGSVYAVVAAAATLVPNYTFHMLFIGPVKIKYIAIFYFFLSFVQLTGANAGGQLAHLGGFAVGYLYIVQLRKGRDIGRPFVQILSFFAGLFKKPPPEAPKRRKEQHADSEQEVIDEILEKISASGYESLTREEKEKLFNASKR